MRPLAKVRRVRRLRRNAAGFTLVETMTALAIFALISGLLSSAVFAVRQTGAAHAIEATATMQALRLNTIFSASIEAMTTGVGPRTQQPTTIFRGDARQISFVAALDGQTERSGLFMVRMQIENGAEGEKGQHLIFERRRLNADKMPANRAQTARLHTSAGTLRFSFVDERQEGAAGTGYTRTLKTKSSWVDAGRIPKRVLLLENERVIAEARLAIRIDSRCIVMEGVERFDRSECHLQ